jgi:4-amino-4-deoxy-L-arabinose transferase-like glycosyltransferase
MNGWRRLIQPRTWAWPRSVDFWIGAALFFFTVGLLSQTSQSVGFTRDEGYYFKAAENYAGYFDDVVDHARRGEMGGVFEKKVIDKHWSYNHEHPVLVKTLFGLSWRVLHKGWGLFSLESQAFRFPAWLFAGLSVALIFLFARRLLSRGPAILCALIWLSLPRTFWHMHLACFDIPVCAAHVGLVYAYHRHRRTWRGALVVGVVFGLAAATKHNVLVVPALFVLHWAVMEARGLRISREGVRIPPLPLAFFAMAVVGPLVFVAHWPYLWPDVVDRVAWYLKFHLNHEHYPILYFGNLLTAPPFPVAFPFVMSAITLPLPVLLLVVMGTVLAVVVVVRGLAQRLRFERITEVTRVALRDGREDSSASVAFLLLINGLYPFVLIALPSSPIFGGTKHWMNGLPFLIILGVWALFEGIRRLKLIAPGESVKGRPLRLLVVAALAFLILLPGFWLSARIHPHGLSAYNAAVGFARGAATAGFQRTFWGYESRSVLERINADAPQGARIHFGDTNRDDHAMYRRDGLLRRDIGFSGGLGGSRVAAVQPQGEFKKQWMLVWNTWKVRSPAEVVHIEGVPLLTLTFKP